MSDPPARILVLDKRKVGHKMTTLNIVAALCINKAPTTSFASINLGSSNISHPLTNCRLYYSQVIVDPYRFSSQERV